MNEVPAVAELLAERRHLLNVAFRMLGSTAEAEDVVQETYARWYALSETEQAEVRVPQAWLTRVASRICLDVLGSARVRRERYVGQWLPEPLPEPDLQNSAVDPADRITLDDSVRMALLVALEALTPAQRVTFVLHDVFALTFDEVAEVVGRTPQACRKLASTARRDVAARRRRENPDPAHRRIVEAFRDACAAGDLEALVGVLDPAATSRSDGGGKVRAALNPIVGADRVARFVLGGLSKWSHLTVAEAEVSGLPGLVFRDSGAVSGVVSFAVRDGRVADVWVVLNPDKLRQWA